MERPGATHAGAGKNSERPFMARDERPHDRARAAGTLQIVATLIAAIFIVSLVLYGLNERDDESGNGKTAAPIAATPQSAPSQQGKQQQVQSQQGGGQQPSAPNSTATQPSGPSNSSTTTGQGPDARGSQNGNAGNKANQPPATASPSAPPPNPANN
jgi:hypothetical protein